MKATARRVTGGLVVTMLVAMAVIGVLDYLELGRSNAVVELVTTTGAFVFLLGGAALTVAAAAWLVLALGERLGLVREEVTASWRVRFGDAAHLVEIPAHARRTPRRAWVDGAATMLTWVPVGSDGWEAALTVAGAPAHLRLQRPATGVVDAVFSLVSLLPGMWGGASPVNAYVATLEVAGGTVVRRAPDARRAPAARRGAA